MTSMLKKVPIPPRGVDYRNKVVLAPMVRSGELPTRLLALHYGADLVWGPETVDRAIIGSTKRHNATYGTTEWTRVPSHGKKTPPSDGRLSVIFSTLEAKEAGKLIFQMGTAQPERALEAARMVAEHVAGIDVNAGCPKPFSTSGGMGAALLKEPDRLCAILEALVQNITPEYGIGISVKIRILDTAAETEALVRRLCATGIIGLTVHCRTTPMRPREPAIRDQLRMVADVCRESGVACLMNGDVPDRDQGLALAAEYGADGAMIATAAEKNPSCFRSQAQGGPLPWQDVVDKYIETCISVGNRFSNSKFLLVQMVPGKAKQHGLLFPLKTYIDTCRALELSHLSEQAQQADGYLGLGQLSDKGPKNASAGPLSRAKKSDSALAAGGQMGQARKQTQQRTPLSQRKASTQQETRPHETQQKGPEREVQTPTDLLPQPQLETGLGPERQPALGSAV